MAQLTPRHSQSGVVGHEVSRPGTAGAKVRRPYIVGREVIRLMLLLLGRKVPWPDAVGAVEGINEKNRGSGLIFLEKTIYDICVIEAKN